MTDNRHILVTGFRPFDNRNINGAESLARALHGTLITNIRIESRLLNVVWADVADFCTRYLSGTNALFVLSLGEADRVNPCFEQLGKPACSGLDVLGNLPDNATAGSSCRKNQLSFREDWFDDPETAPVASQDAGEYLCNYLLLRGLEFSPVPLGFLHVPVQGEQPTSAFVERYLPVVTTLIERNLEQLG